MNLHKRKIQDRLESVHLANRMLLEVIAENDDYVDEATVLLEKSEAAYNAAVLSDDPDDVDILIGVERMRELGVLIEALVARVIDKRAK